MATSSPLQVDVYTAPAIPTQTGYSDPRKQLWSPISCTLIHGPSSAALVDTPITIAQTTALADWVDSILDLYEPKKHLQFIYVTHAHGDHFFGLPILQERFPGVQIVATARVTQGMIGQYTPEAYDARWKKLFPGQLATDRPDSRPLATPLPQNNQFMLDGCVLQAYDVDHSDCQASSILYVPDAGLVVAGDVVYGDCYQHLAEANTPSKRAMWLAALDLVDSLSPTLVVASHKRSSQVDGRYLVAATRQYILDFARLGDEVRADLEVPGHQRPEELERRVKLLYPQRWNDFILDRSCKAFFTTST